MTKTVLVSITKISTVIESIQNGSLTSGSGTTTASTDIIEALVTIVIKIIMKSYDSSYTEALSLITSVTSVASFTSEESVLLIEIGNLKSFPDITMI